jgi:hypothetical protein
VYHNRKVLAVLYTWQQGMWWQSRSPGRLLNDSSFTSHTLPLPSTSLTPSTNYFITIHVWLLTTSNHLPYQPVLHLMYHTLMNLLPSLKGPLLVILFHQSSLGGVQ